MSDEVTAVSRYEDAPDDLAMTTRLKPSLLELVPLTSSKPGAIPGKFRDEVTLEHYDTVTVVPLRIKPGRIMFPPYGSGNNKPICQSYNGTTPAHWIENPPAKTCATCPNSRWGKKDPITNKSSRPACDELFELLVIIKESQLPRIIKFKGNGIVPFNNFKERLETDRIQVNAKEGRKPKLFEYYFTLSAQKKIEPGKISYIPIFTDIKRVNDPNLFGPFYEQYVLQANNTPQQEEDYIDVSIEQLQLQLGTTVAQEPIMAEFVDI